LASIGDAGPEAVPLRHDAFMSYSHAADGLLAPRLQAALQRFAKPWWQRRAVGVFRDESSLSASPHLWGSIVAAMEGSAWFVLLLSPDAAQSPWVTREIDWWVENKEPGRIIPVLTDGTFAWEDGELAGDAVPPSLHSVFSEEPRWVDLRFAREDEQLDLKNPRFSAAVADIASTLRGVPKDELASEEVRQHRRTVRTAWVAAVVLLLFGIAATIGAVVAVDRSNEARAQQRLAEEARAAAETAQGLAEEARAGAELAQALAEDERDRANTEADRANRVSTHLIDLLAQTALAGIVAPGPDVPSGDAPAATTLQAAAPATPRLDFLLEICSGTTCFRDAQIVYPDGRKTSGWRAYEPFHIRHGFVHGDQLLPPDGPDYPGYDLRVFVTRRAGPPLADGSFPIDQTLRFHTDYRVREISEECGTAFALGERTGPQPCEMFVHEFPDGLPPGRYDFWVEWRAPCRAWLGDQEVCRGLTVPLDLVVSQVNMAFLGDGYTLRDDEAVLSGDGD
jgi:type II secretory pathway pseudopilin PulG